MTVESTTQALCDLALRFGEGDEESMSRCGNITAILELNEKLERKFREFLAAPQV
ncbi:Proteasome subunit alpha type-5-A [Castilleja foliolosa]|uniref:Proteasome subunit alpha type-5-A n=1 Tax=Castilleja foliolosa TaxID=1961234 RepID=A0ABD3BZN8_9LAMI